MPSDRRLTWLERGLHRLAELLMSEQEKHMAELQKIEKARQDDEQMKAWLLQMVMHFEGYLNGGMPYKDPLGILTVGYGHVCKPDDPPYPWTQEFAAQKLVEELLEDYMPLAQKAWDAKENKTWRKDKWDSLLPREKAMMISAVYNAGPEIIAGASWPRKKSDSEAGQSFYLWSTGVDRKTGKRVRLAGLVRRRFCEWRLATLGEVVFYPQGWEDWYKSHPL